MPFYTRRTRWRVGEDARSQGPANCPWRHDVIRATRRRSESHADTRRGGAWRARRLTRIDPDPSLAQAAPRRRRNREASPSGIKALSAPGAARNFEAPPRRRRPTERLGLSPSTSPIRRRLYTPVRHVVRACPAKTASHPTCTRSRSSRAAPSLASGACACTNLGRGCATRSTSCRRCPRD
jgi:hypothetical protein